jgi:hypothetical protein
LERHRDTNRIERTNNVERTEIDRHSRVKFSLRPKERNKTQDRTGQDRTRQDGDDGERYERRVGVEKSRA